MLILGAALICTQAGAQQLSQYTQYVFNHFSVNPAVAGSKDCIDVRLGYRQQWVGFDGAPTTGWASLHGAIRPKNKPYMKNKHGIGAFIEADNAGNWGYTRFVLAYAYSMQMSQDYFLSMGFFAGVQQMKLNVGDITLTEFNDPVLGSSASVMVYPELTPGIWIYGKRFFGGIAMHQALGNRINDVGLSSRLSRHTMLSAGYRFPLGGKTSLLPSTLVKFSGAAPMAMDLNAMLEWNKVLALGVGYRNGDALTLMLRVGFLQFFQVGYSYDVTTSKLRSASSNTHEIILAITPCGKESMARRMIKCPAFD